MVGRLVGWLVSWSVGQLAGLVLLAGWSVFGWWAGDRSIVSNTQVEGGVNKCDLIDLAGNQPCGRCAKANAKNEKDHKFEGLNAHLLVYLTTTCPLTY